MGEAFAFGNVWPIVGRDAELRALSEAMDDPGCGGVALVGGPGFGKTRLAARAVELAQSHGMASTSLRATKSGAAIPFGALAPFFVDLAVSADASGDLLQRTIDAIALHHGEERIILMVDDAHELDDASLSLLDQLVQRGCVFIVFTVRTGEGSSETIVNMWKDQQILRIEVGPLPRRDLRALAAMAVGGPVDGSTLQSLVEASAGNVLFLRELVQGAIESGALTSELGLWRLNRSLAHSSRLTDLIEHRLTGLAEQERDALEMVALGDPLELGVLEKLASLAAIERLEARGLLSVSTGEHGPQLRLSHPLYGEVLRWRLPAVRKVRLSRLLADAVESRQLVDGSMSGSEALRVAVWQLDGGGGHLETTLAAARAALRAEDYALAERLARRGWSEWQSVDSALILGDALDYLGRSREAEQVLASATPHSMSDRQRTSLAIRRASALFRSLGEADEADRVIAETSAQVIDPQCERELDALRGDHLLLAGEVAQAIALDQKILLEPGDSAFAQASLDVGTGLALAGRTKEAIDHTQSALAVRVDLDDEEQLSAVGVYLVAQSLALFYHGDLQAARQIADAGYQVSVEKNNADGQAWFASMLGLILLSLGLPVSSANMFREVAALFAQLHHPGQRWGLGGLALASAHLGDARTGEDALAELNGLPTTAVRLQDVGIMRGRAWTALAGGRASLAREQLWDASARAENWGQFATATEALHDLVRIGTPNPAADRIEELAERVDGPMMNARVSFARAARDRDLGEASTAADQFEAMGANLFAAEAAVVEQQLAEVEGFRRRSAAAGARAQRLLSQCEGARLQWLHRPGGSAVELTKREREVALLAARDMSSKEIADQLYVSARTVDNHLQRVYTKLGITGRSKLADHLDPGVDGSDTDSTR